MLDNLSTRQNFTSLEYVKQDGDNVPLSLVKDEFPPVFDETSSITMPSLGDTLSSAKKDSVSTIMSGERSHQSVSILITDTSNVPSINDVPNIESDKEDSSCKIISISNLTEEPKEMQHGTDTR